MWARRVGSLALLGRTMVSDLMRSKRLAQQIERLEQEVVALRQSLNTSYAPYSEVERLNLAFEELAQRAPMSEVERLNLAFEELAGKAPASEVERLDLAFDEVERLERDKAPVTEVQRLNLAFEALSRLQAALDMVLSERSVEVPWVLFMYRGERRVLDVGYSNAEDRYVEALSSLSIPFLVGLDLASPSTRDVAESFLGVQGDVRRAVFKEGAFDLVLCISTIEHVGRDNTIYGIKGEPAAGKTSPDHEAVAQLARWLAPGGRLLLSVPFGSYEDHGWLVNYDAERLDALIAASALEVASARYYEQRGGWVPCNREEVGRRGYRSLWAPHAGAVALLELHKGERKASEEGG